MKVRIEGHLLLGLLCAPIGLVAGLMGWSGLGADWTWMWLSSTLAAFLLPAGVGYIGFRFLEANTWKTGLVVGVVAGLFAHYFAWYFQIVGFYVCQVGFGGCPGVLGMDIINPLGAFVAALGFMGVSLIFTGWFTLPATALIGGLLARRLD